MSYPKLPDFRHLCRLIECHAQLKHEEGASGIQRAADQAGKTLAGLVKKLERLPVDKGLADREPSDLPGILALRPNGPRRMWQEFDEIAYRERLEGALLARMAGCTLGAPVESWPINRMENPIFSNGWKNTRAEFPTIGNHSASFSRNVRLAALRSRPLNGNAASVSGPSVTGPVVPPPATSGAGKSFKRAV